MTDDLPPSLAEFGRQLDDLGEFDHRVATRASARRRRSRLRTLPGAVVAAALMASVAAGATAVLDDDGPSIRADRSPGASVAPRDPSLVATTRVADPGGGLPWILRVYTNARGEDCVALGRLKGGVFGQVQRGRFRALPASTPGSCGDPIREGLVAVREHRGDPPRTAIYGLSAGPGLVDVSVAGKTLRVRPVALGAFLVVVEETAPHAPARLLTRVGGRTVRRSLG